MEKIGFAGLGIMGKPMAVNLLRAGFDVMVYDIDPAAMEALKKEGARPSALKEIGESCQKVFLILPNGKIVQDILFTSDGLLAHLKEGSIVCDMSSVTPGESKECYHKLGEAGIGFLDAPVSGGEPKAIDGSLAFMVGGDQEAFERLVPCFQAMGESWLLVGSSGSGSIAKLANQIIVNLTIAAVSEAFVFAEKAGADPEKVYQGIRGGLAGSVVLDAKLPKILDRDFNPGGKISINHKDIGNVLKTAHEADVPVPFCSQLYEVMQTLKVKGCMGEDHAAIIKYFEDLADVKVEKRVTEECDE
ncbi:NAD(P)-binding domain-containing protein [Lachnospiraceae bacterium 54-53]